MKNPFTAHLQAVHENYWQHGLFALWIAVRMIVAGLACLIHAFFPCFFTRTASTTLSALARELADRLKKSEA